MGNESSCSTPTIKAKNTKDAYTGSICDLFSENVAFQLFNPVYQQTIFVSNVDMIKEDHLVESHAHNFEKRNHFYLKKIDGTDWEGYAIYHSLSGKYVFVSNDRSSSDHIVEAHPYLKEKRNCFVFERQRDHLFTIYNTEYEEYLFVSNDKRGSNKQNNVILSHPHKVEERNLFEIQLIDKNRHSEYDDDQKDEDEVMENDEDEEGKKCVICMDNEKDHVIIPCGHIAICGECKEGCYDGYEDEKCPICRSEISSIIKTYS